MADPNWKHTGEGILGNVVQCSRLTNDNAIPMTDRMVVANLVICQAKLKSFLPVVEMISGQQIELELEDRKLRM